MNEPGTGRPVVKHTAGPWDYVPATEHHGPYVTSDFGSTICDCYVMSQPSMLSTANGGPSKPVSFLAEMADPNARLIAAAPDLLEALKALQLQALQSDVNSPANDWGREALEMTRAAIKKATGNVEVLLKPMPKGPAGDHGQVGWMGGEGP